jgi:hypothetical protein
VVEPVTFDEHPEFRIYRVRPPDVEILVMARGYDDDYLSELLTKLRPVDGDPGLLAELERAQHAAWAKIRERKRRR